MFGSSAKGSEEQIVFPKTEPPILLFSTLYLKQGLNHNNINAQKILRALFFLIIKC